MSARIATALTLVAIATISALLTLRRAPPPPTPVSVPPAAAAVIDPEGSGRLRHVSAALADLERELAHSRTVLAAVADAPPLPPPPGRERWQRSEQWQVGEHRILALGVAADGRVVAADQDGGVALLAGGSRRPQHQDRLLAAAPGRTLRALQLATGTTHHALAGERGWLVLAPDATVVERPSPQDTAIVDLAAHASGFIALDGRRAWRWDPIGARELHLDPGVAPQRVAVDGPSVVVAGEDGALLRLDPAGRTVAARHRPATPAPGLRALACSEAAGLIAVGLDDGDVRLHRLDDLAPAGRLVGHRHPVGHAFFSADGAWLVTLPGSTYNPRIRSAGRCIVWHLATGRMEALLEPGGRSTNAAAFDPVRGLLAVASGQHVQVVALPHGEAVARFRIHREQAPQALAFAADGALLVGATGGLVQAWQPRPEDPAPGGDDAARRQRETELPAAADLSEF